MKYQLKPVVYTCSIEANCPKCGDVYAGVFNHFDEDIQMECAHCSHTTTYFISDPIHVPLRYRSSCQLVGLKRKSRPRRQNDVLPGQLKFGGL